MKSLKLLKSVVTSAFILLSVCGVAQTIGDYRSNAATMNWSATASWQRWNGVGWVAPGILGYPGELVTGIAGTVTILNGHSVTLEVSPAQPIGNLVVGEGTTGILVSCHV